MADIIKLNSISPKANAVLEGYNIVEASDNPIAVLVRSFVMHDWAIPSSVIAVSRAGAGVNNIPCADYAKKGIVVFNTPGANANAVKELVLTAMLLAARNIYPAITWAQMLTGDDVKKQVEKGKAQFNGTEILGKTLGILGLGAIGRKVAASANALGMNVIGYDPYLSDAAKKEIPFVGLFDNMDAIYEKADFITIHMPLTPELKEFMNADSFAKMKDGVIIINAARGELVKTSDIKVAIENGKVRCYVVDFPDSDCLNCKNIVPTPHLGASTEEAEDNCAVMAAEELKEYLEKGNVINSVNFPNLKVEMTKKYRATVISEDKGAQLVDGAVENAKGGIRYSILDSDDKIDIDALKKLDGVIAVREIR